MEIVDADWILDGRIAKLVGRAIRDAALHTATGQLLHEATTDGTVAGLREVVNSFAARQPDVQIAIRKPTMDDVFLALTGAGAAAPIALEERSA